MSATSIPTPTPSLPGSPVFMARSVAGFPDGSTDQTARIDAAVRDQTETIAEQTKLLSVQQLQINQLNEETSKKGVRIESLEKNLKTNQTAIGDLRKEQKNLKASNSILLIALLIIVVAILIFTLL
jgi:uncharacterized protein HemX